METINSVVSTASKAIWGENTATTNNETAGKEPVSGLQGKGTVAEPYDQGNAPNPTVPAGEANGTDATGTQDTNLDVSKPTTTNSIEPVTSELPIRTAKAPEVDTATEPTGPSKSQIPVNPTAHATVGEPKPLENTEGTGVTGASAQKYAPKGSDVVPSESSKDTGAAPSSGGGAGHPETQQGADRPRHAPDEAATEALKAKKDNAETTMKRDPNDHSGEPMRMHNGPEVPGTQEERRDSKVGNPGGQEHGAEPKGTGEQHVKTSGLAADGGDFDATKPGAGKEADRLLEQKGIHRDEKGNMDGSSSTSSGDAGHEKVSKMHKLKEKLHIGHKDK